MVYRSEHGFLYEVFYESETDEKLWLLMGAGEDPTKTKI